jgi:hypothetical protein
MRFYCGSLLLLFLLAGTASARTGISTSTFTLVNNTGQTVNGFDVTLSGPTPSSSSVNSVTFGSPSSSTGDIFDFSDPSLSLLNGASDTLTAQAYPSGDYNTAVGISSFYWTYDGSQVGDTYQPLEPEFNTVYPDTYSVELANNTTSSEDYTSASLTVNGAPVDLGSDVSGTVGAGGTVTLNSGTALDSAAMSFFDIFTELTLDASFTQSPEPGTLPLTVVVLLGGLLGFVRFRRTRA